ncbi:hypothetical protein BFJ70_g17102 [Fusarium oxysporum]|uniref:Uncharacterized protein n=1 Tax=Fusarium oxysporum f. sp. radicis-cucumerinum TaxID=327505 RepID=A0A2H3G5V7_FUSOX|nr:hypothetical protein AU210_016529 [Fusarium oxysporum f. sp. radicis-cucumerinum]RKL05602.1 hypothetical protein BFJ70_g17102 [Fusarium oxysporum]
MTMAASQIPSKAVTGYNVGEIKAKGAFSSEITFAKAGLSLSDIINSQYPQSLEMMERPGMQLKYLPTRFDEVTGKLLTGGAYLFDKWEEAVDYSHWTTNEYTIDEEGTKFWSQWAFDSPVRFAWKVIGAYNFAPIEHHAIGHFKRWSYTSNNIEAYLHEVYPQIKSIAEAQGAVAVWLLHQPEDKMIAVQLAYRKPAEGVSLNDYLVQVKQKSGFDRVLATKLTALVEFDRASILLTIWLPLSLAKGGADHTVPNYPVVPAIQTGTA